MKMSLSVAIQMDPLESIDLEADSTYLIALEAKKRNHKIQQKERGCSENSL